MEIEWRECAPGYFVSSDGQVRSGEKAIKPWVVKSTGYAQVDLAGKRFSVHRLVAAAFHVTPLAGQVVNHKNGVRCDNRAENLEWVTHSDNLRHGYRVLGSRNSCEGKFSGEHPTSKAVVATHRVTGEVRRYASAMDAVREGFDSSAISRCCHGHNAWHRGYYWRFELAHAFGAERGVKWGADK